MLLKINPLNYNYNPLRYFWWRGKKEDRDHDKVVRRNSKARVVTRSQMRGNVVSSAHALLPPVKRRRQLRYGSEIQFASLEPASPNMFGQPEFTLDVSNKWTLEDASTVRTLVSDGAIL